MKQQKIEHFTDLDTWKQAHRLAIMIYRETKKFPSHEQFGLTSQIRRAAVSVSSNIAEGFSRATKADKLHFNVMAKGSLTELQSQLLLARDIKYIEVENFEKLAEQSVSVQRLLTGLMRAINNGKGVKHEH